MIALVVALFGGLGAVTRFIVDAEISRRAPRIGVPLGTVVINISGSFMLAVIAGWWGAHTGDPTLKLALGTGFMGGFTTFSTASVEAARLLRAGEGWRMTAHAGGILVLSVASTFVGFWLGSL